MAGLARSTPTRPRSLEYWLAYHKKGTARRDAPWSAERTGNCGHGRAWGTMQSGTTTTDTEQRGGAGGNQ